MGFKLFSFAGFSFYLFVGLTLHLQVLELCSAGTTSSYVRKFNYSIDMPLDSDVFRVPHGYNAPQQVISAISFSVCALFVFLFQREPVIFFEVLYSFLVSPSN